MTGPPPSPPGLSSLRIGVGGLVAMAVAAAGLAWGLALWAMATT